MICSNSKASIDGRAVSYDRAIITIYESCITIWRMDPPAPPPWDRKIAHEGPHFRFYFPRQLVVSSFSRRRSAFVFEGPKVGFMQELHGAPARDGTYTHEVSRFKLVIEINPKDECVSLLYEGSLAVMEQFINGWPVPRKRDRFRLEMEVKLKNAAELFGGTYNAQEGIDYHIAKNPNFLT